MVFAFVCTFTIVVLLLLSFFFFGLVMPSSLLSFVYFS